MGFNDILKSLFGNKSDRDMKELMPIVAKVNAEWEKLKSISADELRAVAEDMKKEVREYIGEEENEIAGFPESGTGRNENEVCFPKYPPTAQSGL